MKDSAEGNELAVISGALRLAAKYNMVGLRDRLADIVTRFWPAGLLDWDGRMGHLRDKGWGARACLKRVSPASSEHPWAWFLRVT